jgi:hypothetical protein
VCGGHQAYLRCAKAGYRIHPQIFKIFLVEQGSTSWIFEIFIHNLQAQVCMPFPICMLIVSGGGGGGGGGGGASSIHHGG